MAKRASAKSAEKDAGSPAFGPSTKLLVLAGKEPFLRSAHTDHLRESIEREHGEVELLRFDGESASVADVLDECRSFGLLQQHKIVVVDNADEFVKGDERRPLIERYAANPPENATLVLRCETWRKGNLDKLIEKQGAIVACDAVTEAQAIRWAVNRVEKRYEASIDKDAAELLVRRLGPDLGRIDSELAKLAVAAGTQGTIDVRTVADLVALTREETVWLIQNSLIEGHAESSLRKARELIDVSRVPTVLLRFALIDLAKKLHGACRWNSDGKKTSPPNIWPFDVRRAVMAASERLAPRDVRRLLTEAVEADARAKTGQGDEILAIEALILRFASVLAR